MPTHLLRNRLIYFVIGLVFLIGVFLFVGFGYYLSTPAEKGGDDQVFFVRDGSTLNEVTSELESKRIITGKRLFLLWARLMGYSRSIKAGEYRLSSAMPPLKILEILSKGAVITHPVTIPEGYTIKQIGELLEEKGLVKNEEFLAITGDPDVAKRYDISGQSLEGYLYPDTYQFGRGLSPMSVVEVIVKHFWEVIGPLREKIEQSGMTIEEVITLASIVEKETGRAEERPIIASVFLNRLKKRMRLESDPTVIYGIKDFSGNLKKKHLTQRTPYNTYVIRGLPPGPIANPGKEAIEAVLFPAKTDYLYFVSKNDGSHYFSKTLVEHNKAVEIYQKKKRMRRKKSS
ncbi:MAG: endolytic transglycosylase MltG [Pseudomonadota bacterium]